ncbi:hypothetical protein H8356DRAFT_1346354 [Neocallimastix lanati (nom. inval.)]|nr:hypothetical protein H8356DRAFT_1346354 [Neocallimastix sp. JGI-2020a]
MFLSQSWFNDGYMITRNLKQGLGGESLPVKANLAAEELLKEMNDNSCVIYTHKNKEFHTYKKGGINSSSKLPQIKNEPHSSKILRFFGYYKESTYQSYEQYHLRKVVIYYYLEDNTMRVNEPQTKNSKICSKFYIPKDFNIGINIQLYAKTIRIVDCDEFTRRYYKEIEKIDLNPTEMMPEDPYQLERKRPLRIKSNEQKNYPLTNFLEYDRKVLRFYCVWDNRKIHRQNNGRNRPSLLLKKQQLPKVFIDMNDIESSEKYRWSDFKIGSVINFLRRKCLIYDCDEDTRSYFMKHLGMSADELKPYIVPKEKAAQIPKQTSPQYNGFGSDEDSLDRRFILNYHVNDDKISIYEPIQRNSNITSGYFAEVFKKTASIVEKVVEKQEEDIFNSQNPAEPTEYYTSKDLYVNEFVFNYMEFIKDEYLCLTLNIEDKENLKQKFPVTTIIKRKDFIEALSPLFSKYLTLHEIITLSRSCEDNNQKVDIDKVINIINVL